MVSTKKVCKSAEYFLYTLLIETILTHFCRLTTEKKNLSKVKCCSKMEKTSKCKAFCFPNKHNKGSLQILLRYGNGFSKISDLQVLEQ